MHGLRTRCAVYNHYMKNTIVALIVVLLLIGVGLASFFILQQRTRPGSQVGDGSGNQLTPGGGNSTTVVPGGSGGTQGTSQGSGITSAGVSVPLVGGQTLQVKDFKKDPATLTSKNLPGHYYLAGGIGSTAGIPFRTFYLESDGSFRITLLQEPLSETRAAAESDLMARLGITEKQMCGLNYIVSVLNSVNPNYPGRNLGFSFCPGAEAL